MSGSNMPALPLLEHSAANDDGSDIHAHGWHDHLYMHHYGDDLHIDFSLRQIEWTAPVAGTANFQ